MEFLTHSSLLEQFCPADHVVQDWCLLPEVSSPPKEFQEKWYQNTTFLYKRLSQSSDINGFPTSILLLKSPSQKNRCDLTGKFWRENPCVNILSVWSTRNLRLKALKLLTSPYCVLSGKKLFKKYFLWNKITWYLNFNHWLHSACSNILL